MRLFRAFRIVRSALLFGALGISLLAMPNTAAAQNIGDDECFDVTGNGGCDVEGFAVILDSTGPFEIDTYVETVINSFELLDQGYQAEVDGFLYDQNGNLIDSTSAFDDGSGDALAAMSDPASVNNIYQLQGDHSIVDDLGNVFFIGSTYVAVPTYLPTISSFTPTFGYVGTSGTITVQGSALFDPFTGTINASFGSGTGLTLSPYSVTPDGTQLTLLYTIAQNASVGPVNIVLSDRFGITTSTQTFNVGDPSPVINSVSPAVWQAGTTIPITISGTGFGTNPSVSVAGTGVTPVSVGSVSDTQISATVSIASNAPNETAPVTVQSNGYYGSGFQPAFPGESSSSTYNALVQAAPPPAPQIQLYGQTITTTQSVVAGQQMALSATVSLPPGTSISSQQWSMPEGNVVGGYNASPSGGCVVLIQGQASQQGSCSGNPVSTTNSSFAFYWVDAGSSRAITYTYTLNTGASNSATATFNVDAPSGVTVGAPQGGQIQSAVNIVPPPTNTSAVNPVLLDGNLGVPGINLLASATHLPSGGKYQWVQLIKSDVVKIVCPTGPQIKTLVSSSALPALDNVYPYSHVTTTTVPNDGANDSPAVGLLPTFGELARSFSASMYLTWVPPALGACPNGDACTIPVPLGSFQWTFWGDGINTLMQQTHSGVVFPLWNKNAASGSNSNNGFAASNSFATWNTTFTNLQIGCS